MTSRLGKLETAANLARHVAAVERLLEDSRANPDRYLLAVQQVSQAKRALAVALAALDAK